MLLELLKQQFPLELRPVPRQELLESDEVFMASSTKEVIPVVQVDDHNIGTRTPGPITRKTMEIFKNYTDRYGA